ncbi:MAG: glycosyltransferase [Chthoniobacterales bacterium]
MIGNGRIAVTASSIDSGTAVSAAQPALVSIITACYNQGHFLREAIESAVAQTYARREIIVVDDGSTDNTPEIARRYPEVRYICQENAGPSAARNNGVKSSAGEYLVFLDADDRLLPDALEVGVQSLQQNPDCAFASGFCRLVVADGSLLSQPEQPCITGDAYLELLRRNDIWCPGSVIYRRSAFQAVGGFNESLGRGEDYDLFLRITREYPVFCHKQFVADYRLHGSSRSSDYSLMLKDMLSVLDAQADFVRGSERHAKALESGKAYWRDRYEHLQLGDRIRELVDATLPPDATVAIASGGRAELLKLGNRRVLHFPQAKTHNPGRLFQQGVRGAVDVAWIEAGMRYEFCLFGGSNGGQIAALSVVGIPSATSADEIPVDRLSAAHLNASPNPVPAPNRFGRTTISWNTGDGSEGRIYLSQGGTYDSSVPKDSKEAISRLETIRARGAHYLLLPATALWWLDQYQAFADYLNARYPTVARDKSCCVVFDLHPTRAASNG